MVSSLVGVKDIGGCCLLLVRNVEEKLMVDLELKVLLK